MYITYICYLLVFIIFETYTTTLGYNNVLKTLPSTLALIQLKLSNHAHQHRNMA
jgi:hypothetical protein